MPIYIIAEAGVNHNGSFELACRMIDAAKAAGADCVKFQTFISKNCVSSHAKKAEYQVHNGAQGDSQLDMVQRLELPFEAFQKMMGYCTKIGIDFLSTPFDLESILFLMG